VSEVLGGQTWQVLTMALQAQGLRQRVIAHNVANLNTPGFKKSEVVFEEILKDALTSSSLSLARTYPRHLGSGRRLDSATPRVIQDRLTAARPDGNNVDLNEQMVQLAMNTFYYQVTAQAISNRLARLRYVISGGRR